MSRHGKFYSDLKRGGVYDDDDDYDYDDDYYGEEEYHDEVAPQGKVLSNSKTAASTATGKTPSTDHLGIPMDDPDYDIVAVQAKVLRELVGSATPITRILGALREANYDVDAAAMALMGSPSSPQTPAFPSRPAFSPTTSTVKHTGVVRTGGGKTLKLSVTPTVQAQTPTTSCASPAADVSAAPSPAPSPAASPSTSKPPRYGAASSVSDEDGKQTCTVIIAGHVDSGKSTILGHILLQLGVYTDKDVERNERDGRSSGKQSFKYAWLLDQSEEERRRGVTIDAGAHSFETAKKRVHVLDAPGHKDFVMNMISSATQADLALLVVTAATGEFESGLQHGTKEHLTILKTLGVGRLVVAINKMDAVDYSKERYEFVIQELSSMLKQTKFRVETDVLCFCPVSGMVGVNLTLPKPRELPWYDGPSLLDVINDAPLDGRFVDAPLRLTLQDVQKQTLYCRVECGKVAKGETVVFVPCGVKVVVRSIDRPSAAGVVSSARAGDTVEITTNSDLTGLYPACVGCHPKFPVSASTDFECHIQTFPNLVNAILPGALFMLAVHSLTVPVTVACLVSRMDKSGNWSTGMVKCIPPNTQAIAVLQAETPIALEPAEVVRALGRFVLRQGGETVAGGLVTKVLPMK